MRNNRNSKQAQDINTIKISLSSPEDMLERSSGEVVKPETINYRTYKPESGGLFCERVFGPTKDFECHCGKYKRIRYRGIVCDRCGVEVTEKKVRRERVGHISLVVPVAHIWYFRTLPNKIGYLLGLPSKRLDMIIYYERYVVIQAGNEIALNTEGENVKYLDFLTEEEYLTILDNLPTENQYLSDSDPNKFIAKMGAEALHDLLANLNLDELSYELRHNAANETSQQRKTESLKRLQVVESMRESQIHTVNNPEWMIVKVIPVIPPELRPLVPLDGGRFATSDLNDLYRRVIIRNNRLKRLMEINAPDIILRNEKRMLQESVDALFDNSRKSSAVKTDGKRALKSLSDSLKGKQGRFRQNLLGKRVDYSARSVIVVGPHLQLQQCGLPKMMALELFKPFVMKRLVELGLAQNIKSAKRMVERSRAQVWDVLAEVIEEHPVLLNRAPTLHRLGIQAFEPILVEGKAIQVHPLVCEAFNADFDGDQMAVHVPLSAEAQAEARVLMLATNNVLSPASGNPIVSPSQDMVIGLYYITECYEKLEDAKMAFVDINEAEQAYEAGHIGLQTPIRLRVGEISGDAIMHGEIKNRFADLITESPVDGSALLNTTLGRVYFNEVLPKDFPFIQAKVRKNEMKRIISEVIERYNKAELREFLDAMKDVGFKYGAKAGLSVAMTDVKTPPEKSTILEKHESDAERVENQFNSGVITEDERKKAIIEIWTKATDEIQYAMSRALEADEFNPVDMMVKSGARGNMMQVRQLAGMRGLVANPKGDIIERPIKSNFREGMSVLEYFISTHGARKGLADTALRTADSGYLTRRLVDVAAGIVVKDQGDENIDWRGTKKTVIESDGKVSRYLHSKLYGRVLAEDVKKDKKLVEFGDSQKLTKGTYVDAEVLDAISKCGVESVNILSPFNSQDPETMDPLCYGFSLATGKPVEVGEAVGIISAQSIGEPGTQLTMRTFHTGGVVGLDITSGLPRIVELFEARNPKGKSVMSSINGKIKSIDTTPEGTRVVTIQNEKEDIEVEVLRRQTLVVNQGDTVEAGDALTTGPKAPKEVLEINGVRATQEYLVDEVQKTYRDQGVEVHDKHVEMIVRQMLRRVRIVNANDSDYLPNELVDSTLFRKTNQALVKEGKTPAEGRPELMGITKASLATDSWLSAASFQETTRVLTEAAMKKSTDALSGLKENVIIGTLIPAGTGSEAYQKLTPSLPDAPEVSSLGFMEASSDSEETDGDALPNPAQWLAMLGEEGEEETE